jgi:hypothetical protein
MASRKQNTAQAKAAKQKKIAIGGAVLLVGVAAIQGPKMLKLMSGGSSGATAAPVVAPVPVAPVPGAAPATPATATPTATGTKLVSFERFSSKDPFNAQIVEPTTSSSNDNASQGAAATPTATGTAGTGVAVVPKATSSTASNATANVKKIPSQQQLVIAGDSKGTATIKVNGTSEDVSKGGDFPKSDPTFTLVKFGANGASVTIGIAGGSLKVGGKTFVLNTGESKTLLNTADGKRYTLTLVSVQEPNG